MDPMVRVIELPLSTLMVACCGLAGLWGACILFLQLSRSRKSRAQFQGEAERDWGIPVIDAQAQGNSPFHRWDPRVKIVSLLLYMLCLASLKHLALAGLGLLSSLVAVLIARIPLRYPLKRLAAMGTFLTMFVVVMPLTAPIKGGDTVVSFQHAAFVALNLRGLFLALLICAKACAIAVLMEPLLSTSPFPVTIQALASLRVPSWVCQMILLAHRYVFVFQDETRRMLKGMAARGFEKRTNMETLRTVGNFLGMLMVRSFERTQRIYDAMLSRGYDGSLPDAEEFCALGSDWAKAGLCVLLGAGLLVADRLLH
jgi:cobalt/nickel transport system permease protein